MNFHMNFDMILVGPQDCKKFDWSYREIDHGEEDKREEYTRDVICALYLLFIIAKLVLRSFPQQTIVSQTAQGQLIGLGNKIEEGRERGIIIST
jgi:hypothetical protein